MTRTQLVPRLALFLAVCLAILFACGVSAEAQNGNAPDPVAHVTLGQSAVPLFGPWKFTVGDSQVDAKTGKPLWAEPGFDDSSWETGNQPPKKGGFNPGGG